MAVHAPAVPSPATARDAVTVGEVQRVVLPGSRVAGGRAGLGRRVTWATSLRSRPPAFELRGGGELVLASPAALDGLRQVDAGLTIERILEGLSQAGAAALALPGPISARARAAADTLGMPLIELADAASVLDAERGVISLVLDRHNELQARASELYRRLAQLAVEGHGVEAILDEAARATGRSVVLEDGAFRLRHVALPPGDTLRPPDDAGLSSVDERGRLVEFVRNISISSTTPTPLSLPAARIGLHRWTAPVATRDRPPGYVSLCGPEDALTEFDQLAASRTAAICALELAKEEAVHAAEQRVQRDLVDELLAPGADVEQLQRRAAQAGLSTSGLYAVVVLSVAERGGGDAERSALFAAADAVTRFLRQDQLRAAMRTGQDDITLVLDAAAVDTRSGTTAVTATTAASRAGNASPVATAPAVAESPSGANGHASGQTDGQADGQANRHDERLTSVAQALFHAAQAAAGNALSAGVSRACARLADLPQGGVQARDALRIGRRVHGAGKLVAYADLGLYRVLHVLRDSAELVTFYEQTLGPLVEYDRRTGQSLIETLEVFFACHGNLSQTAQRLHHHRNSLLYRIGRIQDISGLDLEDPEARLSLQVALKARRLLS